MMAIPGELLAQSLAKLRTAKRISGQSASYKKDNPAEYAKVIVYLDGGARPSGVTTDMGIGLLLAEDARRGLVVTPPPDPSPSGEPMPVGDLPGWRQVFTDDFTTNVPLGQFPAAVAGKWNAYPQPWKDTSRNGTYWPEKTVSIHDGVMDIWLHTENGVHLVSNPVPRIGGDQWGNQLYGRYAIRYKVDAPIPGYKQAWLLWPQSDVHPRDGEIDFPECDFNSGFNIMAFMHRQNGTSGSDQDFYDSGVDVIGTGWHTCVIEWLPNSCKFILDGRVIGHSTARVPSTPMGWRIQSETWVQGPAPADSAQGHILIDWVAVWARA